MSSPATTLIALLFSAMLSTAAPRPRRARYTAATAFGRLVTMASTSPPVTMSATPYRCPSRGGRHLHDRARPDHGDERENRGDRVPPGARPRPDRLGQLVLLLVHRRDQPARPPGGQRQRLHPVPAHPQHRHVRPQHRRGQHQPRRGRQHRHRQQGHGGHPHRRHPGQQHHPAVEGDPPGYHRGQPEQRGQVEDVRPDHHPRPDAGLAPRQRGHRGGDLRGVGGQRRDQPQPGLGEPGPLAEPLQPRDQQPARGQARRHPGGE